MISQEEAFTILGEYTNILSKIIYSSFDERLSFTRNSRKAITNRSKTNLNTDFVRDEIRNYFSINNDPKVRIHESRQQFLIEYDDKMILFFKKESSSGNVPISRSIAGNKIRNQQYSLDIGKMRPIITIVYSTDFFQENIKRVYFCCMQGKKTIWKADVGTSGEIIRLHEQPDLIPVKKQNIRLKAVNNGKADRQAK